MRCTFQAFVDRLVESKSPDDLRQAMAKAASALDLCSFAYLAPPRTGSATPLLISSYPTTWTSHYLRRNYERIDPVLAQAFRRPEPFRWGEGLGPATRSDEEREMFEEAAKFGLRCGFTIPVHDSEGAFAAVTFATDECRASFERTIDNQMWALQLMAMSFHAHVRRKLAPDVSIGGATLSRREIQCLKWAAEGKSAWEAGRIMGISQHTVAFHLENAKAKLGVRSTIQAVARIAAANRSL
ncbi:LuxR family transcriptional regulator [Bradyrhizobium arachidis]|uniref:LuxR family transcriptional regulator n=1 Tax=Bradyrhizobium arachidis TaxID=858423 RepID=A0AAE7NYK7_9BRAD|nr:LuxR family transcriptional regulator [Bradyrhizobium arachidis]QOZ73716.1 LuxR family transcriptional regulator [Bradyrhizobium arachidis]SFV19215.1 DNA-binding transcriptional regulator, CsgD family [Bradyrhizobium arachidis]